MLLDVQLDGRPDTAAARARELAGTGVAGLFTFEGPHDVFLPLAAAAGAVETDLMTNVAIAIPRSPMHLAHAAYDLQLMSQGRFRLGLGSQVRPHIEHRYGATWDRPAARMREAVMAVKAILTAWQEGSRLDFRGEFTRHTLMPPTFVPGPNPYGVPPVLLGALGPVMTRTAAEVADGLLVMPFHSHRHFRERTLPMVDAGLEAAGRTRADLAIQPQAILAMGRTDDELARATVGAGCSPSTAPRRRTAPSSRSRAGPTCSPSSTGSPSRATGRRCSTSSPTRCSRPSPSGARPRSARRRCGGGSATWPTGCAPTSRGTTPRWTRCATWSTRWPDLLARRVVGGRDTRSGCGSGARAATSGLSTGFSTDRRSHDSSPGTPGRPRGMHRWDPIAPPVSGLVVPVHIDPTGISGPTRAQARGPRWRITSPGWAVPAHVSDTLVEQRILEAHARGGDEAVITGWAALRLQGGGFFDGLARDGRTRLAVPVAANGARLRSRDGIDVVADRIPPDEVVVVHGMRCARVERALFDEMRRIGEVREMAVAIGAACAARLTSVRRMRAYVATRRWYRGICLAREAVELAVEGARSPQEDRFRLIWELDAGWGRPLLNRDVFDEHGRWVATPDLLDPVRWVAGEYAGADHRDRDQHAWDVSREADLRAVGLEYVEVVGRDLRARRVVVRRMEQAAERAVHLTRRWHLGPPARSLDELLDERDRDGRG